MSRNQKLNLFILSIINVWMVLIPFYGEFFNDMVVRSGNDLKVAQIICLCAYQLSIILSTFLFRDHNIKKLMTYGLAALILLSATLWYLPGFQGFTGYLMLGLLSGFVRALFCHYIFFGFDAGVSVKTVSITFGAAYLGLFLFKYVNLLSGTDTVFILATLLLAAAFVLNLFFDQNELTLQSSIKEKPFPYKPIMFIGITFFLALFCNGLIRNSIYPRQAIGASFLEYIPEIAVFLTAYLFSTKVNRLLMLNCTISLVGLAYLGYILGGSFNLASNILVDLSIATFDIYLYSVIIYISRIHGRSYGVFRIVMVMFAMGTLSGDYLGKAAASLASGFHLYVPIILLVIIFAFMFFLPWISKHLKADFSEPDKADEKVSPVLQLVNYGKETRSNSEADFIIKIRKANSILPEGRQLTSREIEIASLLLERYDYATIAEKLFITQNTLKVHIRHIYQKFDVSKKKDFIEKVELLSKPFQIHIV